MKQIERGIIYCGPSMLDGAPIVMVAVLAEKHKDNPKTGRMLQTYILRADISPMDVIESGQDASICGDCVHRGSGKSKTGKRYGKRSCYVNIGQGPLSVFRAFKRGSYKHVDAAEIGRNRLIRLGTYGDPAAVPYQIWIELLKKSAGRTGYTHQWQNLQGDTASAFRYLVMASCDSSAQADSAQAQDWRTFRVRHKGEQLRPREFVCPASRESAAYGKVTCADCLACDGAGHEWKTSTPEAADGMRKQRHGNPVIYAHGSLSGNFATNAARVIPIRL